MGQGTVQWGYVHLPGGGTAVYTNGTLGYYRHPDWLGSSRLASTPSRTMYADTAYAPFGETYVSSGSADPAFTGQRQDTVSGLYDFPAREYSIQGRWPSPDPAGLAAVDPTSPQSWNRYAYAKNNPLNRVDPLGLDDCSSGLLDATRRARAAVRKGRIGRGPRAQDDCGGGGGGGGILDGGGGTNNGIGDLPLDANGGPGIDGMGLGLIVSDGSSSVAPNNLLLLPTDSVDSGQSQVLTPDTGPATYDEYVFQQLAPGVVQGAGVIGDPNYVVGFYVSSAALGSMGSAGALWDAGAQAGGAGTELWEEGMGRLIEWQVGDFEGYQATTEMIYNIINGEIVPEGASQGAVAGALLGCLLFGDKPCPGVLKLH